MLDLRLYPVTLLPFAIGLILVAFSLHARPTALPGATPTASFDGPQAQRVMSALAAGERGERTPGSAADSAIAGAIAAHAAPYGFAGAGFPGVRIVRAGVETAIGARTIDTVIATRPGTGPGIALIADRGSSSDTGSLAPTAALLEIANVYKNLVTRRPLTLVSTAGGASGMIAAARELPGGIEAAIVLGAVPAAGGAVTIVPWSTSGGLAPPALRATLEASMAAALGARIPDVSFAEQFARLALPITTGAQGPLGAAGFPGVLVSAGGESAPAAAAASADGGRLGAFGQGILAAAIALDGGSSLAVAPTREISIGTQIVDGWGIRVVGGLLALSVAACSLDVLARARRRRVPVMPGVGWVLSLAAPFLLAGLFAIFLGASGLLPAIPAAPVTTAQLPIGSAGVAALVSVSLLFVLAWVLRAAVRRRRRDVAAPEPVGAGAALLATATVLAFLVWLANPYTALLLIVPLHVWLVALTREHTHSARRGVLALVASLAPPLAAFALICVSLAVSPFELLWTLVALVAGGALSFGGLLLGSVACACFVAAGLLLLRPGTPHADLEITVRGPLRYAGPGSLGGTESALHR